VRTTTQTSSGFLTAGTRDVAMNCPVESMALESVAPSLAVNTLGMHATSGNDQAGSGNCRGCRLSSMCILPPPASTEAVSRLEMQT
jgi:hypothetical protein